MDAGRLQAAGSATWPPAPFCIFKELLKLRLLLRVEEANDLLSAKALTPPLEQQLHLVQVAILNLLGHKLLEGPKPDSQSVDPVCYPAERLLQTHRLLESLSRRRGPGISPRFHLATKPCLDRAAARVSIWASERVPLITTSMSMEDLGIP